MNPKVSICIPAYNQTKYLKKVLDSVFEQTFTDFEVIVSDDSTTEVVAELVQEYQKGGHIIRYFRNRPGLGSPKNWNFAIQQAKGEYIKMMHHDDWFITSDALRKLVTEADRHENALVFSGGESCRMHGTSIHLPNPSIVDRFQKQPMDILKGNFIGGPSGVLFRNRGFLFDENLKWIVDIDFYIQLLKNDFTLVYLKEVLYASTIAEHNITNDCINNYELNLFEFTHVYRKNAKSLRIKIKYWLVINKILNEIQNCNPVRLYFHLNKKSTP
jgi:glycosyltransferase involved in cell wall biosynthesis